MQFLSIMITSGAFSFFIAPCSARSCWDALEARRHPAAGSGIAARDVSSIACGPGSRSTQRSVGHRRLFERQGHGGKHVRALWSWIVLLVVTVAVSLVTRPLGEKQLTGLVYGMHRSAVRRHLPLFERPIFWAGVVLVVSLCERSDLVGLCQKESSNIGLVFHRAPDSCVRILISPGWPRWSLLRRIAGSGRAARRRVVGRAADRSGGLYAYLFAGEARHDLRTHRRESRVLSRSSRQIGREGLTRFQPPATRNRHRPRHQARAVESREEPEVRRAVRANRDKIEWR